MDFPFRDVPERDGLDADAGVGGVADALGAAVLVGGGLEAAVGETGEDADGGAGDGMPGEVGDATAPGQGPADGQDERGVLGLFDPEDL